MARALEIGDRVTWTIRDHGKEKKLIGLFGGSVGSTAHIDVGGKKMTTTLSMLRRCRGRKPRV